MAERSVYKSSTLGDIPLSFTGRQLLQQLRIEMEDMLRDVKKGLDVSWDPLSRARGRLAQYMSKLEGKTESPERTEDQAFPPHFAGDRSYVVMGGRPLSERAKAYNEGYTEGRRAEHHKWKNRLNSLYGESQWVPTLDTRTQDRCKPRVAPLGELVVEHLYEFKIGGYDVRLWLSKEEDLESMRRSCTDRYNLLAEEGQRKFMKTYAKDLSVVLPNVNAVQVKRGEASVVIYPDWP